VKSALPAWLAAIEHVPTATIVTVLPDTVQTDAVVEVKLTGKPELAVAVMANGATPSVTLPNAANVIACASWKLNPATLNAGKELDPLSAVHPARFMFVIPPGRPRLLVYQ
jgi:hypothetical protein